jgi:hypothetical protein
MSLIAVCRKNRSELLGLVSLFVFLVLLPLRGLARNPEGHPRVSLDKRIALPELSDALGWKQPMYYSTIQTADIDGDGQTEVLARWIDGLTVYRFENGTLLRHSRLPALSDNAGFYQPSWYSTIRTAVLEAKLGQADILAREGDGIHVFRYDGKKHQWRELGAHASVRPFADTDASGTNWTKPEHYLTIQLADLTGDGAAELVGRGHNGMQTWRWNPAAESWTQLCSAGVLADDNGFNQEPYYYSIQLVDVDRDGVAELLARAPAGVQTYKWNGGGWSFISASGPFGDDAGFLADKRYKSVRASVDARGRAWLYGLTIGTAGAGSGAIQIHRWNEDHWELVQTLSLPDRGWDRESQFSTLVGADLQGDATPEFLVRGPRGLHAFTLDGHALPMHSRSFNDAQGWNLTEQYGTLHTATATLKENGESHTRTLVLGRGSKGLEAYKFLGQWEQAADSNFPQYCTNFNNDNSPQCVAYKAISNAAEVGQVDIRSQYPIPGSINWTSAQSIVNMMANPNGPNNDANWQAVHSEMVQELGYVATVTAWFGNNAMVIHQNYDDSAGLLIEAQSDASLASGTSVVAKWVEFAADIVSGIARFFPGEGTAISLVISVFQDTYNNIAGSNGDVTEQIGQIATDLNNQKQNWTTSHANEETSYMTDYSKLQQIGTDSATGGYDWANATFDDIANAENGADQGMLVNFYRTLIPYKWQVLWCTGNQYPECPPLDTPDNYNCSFGVSNDGYAYNTNAYISTGPPPFSPPLNWSLADKLTGTGPNEVNAIWYMMLLGGDLGWDLPGQQWVSNPTGPGGGFVPGPLDPELAYDNLKYGYNGPSSNCLGAGSTTGILSSSQTLSQRLTVAQQNTRRVTASEANGILGMIDALKHDTKAASTDAKVETDLVSPLREAAKLIARAKLPGRPGVEGSVSATTPTHLLELFVRRVELNAPDLGKRLADRLAAGAYELIAQLEGQTQTR